MGDGGGGTYTVLLSSRCPSRWPICLLRLRLVVVFVDLALACGVGDIAFRACIMAMPIVQRPSCLTLPGTRQALVLLSLIP